jgi:hypothetical protein
MENIKIDEAAQVTVTLTLQEVGVLHQICKKERHFADEVEIVAPGLGGMEARSLLVAGAGVKLKQHFDAEVMAQRARATEAQIIPPGTVIGGGNGTPRPA